MKGCGLHHFILLSFVYRFLYVVGASYNFKSAIDYNLSVWKLTITHKESGVQGSTKCRMHMVWRECST